MHTGWSNRQTKPFSWHTAIPKRKLYFLMKKFIVAGMRAFT